MTTRLRDDVTLGLDIGSNSVGWALISDKGDAPQVLAAGSRIFPLGVDEQSFESRNIERRMARHRRRQTDRKRRRSDLVAGILRRNGFLPAGKPSHASDAWKSLLDSDPYALRARALDTLLAPMEFGRVIFHLCQRRGFKSNRKSDAADNDSGTVKSAIKALDLEMNQAGVRTLGEYLSKQDPHERRIRERYTARDWYRHEFDAICAAQRKLGLQLDTALERELRKAIFFQRKVWWDHSTIGYCPFEPRRLRSHVALPECQRFRMLQDVNNLRVVTVGGKSRDLTADERSRMLQKLDTVEKLTFRGARRLLKLPHDTTFNIEEGGREKLKGNVTATRIRKAIGDKWDYYDDTTRAAVLEAVMSIESEDLLARLAMRKPWGLNHDEAEALSGVNLEADRLALSSRAVRRLLPDMEAGMPYASAARKCYPRIGGGAAADLLPPLEDLRNPTAQRALTETRRVVNAIIKRFGRPGRVRIEMARDLKKPKKKRVELWKAMRTRELDRRRAREKIIKDAGVSQPKHYDIEKALLWEECRGMCPYTGKSISFSDLFGDQPRFDVEHIIPWSRSLDNSFANKTLCEVEENRHRKKNRTPFEAYSGDEARYQAILKRVGNFNSQLAREKLRRFLAEDPEGPEGMLKVFSGAQLHATAQAARRAAEYLGLLYPEAERLSRIQVSAGRTTSALRSAWRLNELLGFADEKNRADHRHHALDAIVVALTTPRITKELTAAAQRAQRPGTFREMPIPTGLRERIGKAIEEIVVSHRVDRRVNGQMHEEMFYGVIRGRKGQPIVVRRKPLDALSAGDVQKIVDPAIRQLVTNALNGGDPKRVFAERANRPVVTSRTGRVMRIRRVRVEVGGTPVELAEGDRQRLVFPGNNHHLELFQAKDTKGQPTWHGDIVSRLDAMKRARMGDPVISRHDKSGNPLVFSLAIGDTVRMTWGDRQVIAVVQKLSDHYYVFREHTDGRMAKDITNPIRIRSDNTLMETGCQKLSVDCLGYLHVSHD